jgi:hypothetical protein
MQFQRDPTDPIKLVATNWKLVIISRLISYDERMVTTPQVWFSAPNSIESSNVFVSDPV